MMTSIYGWLATALGWIVVLSMVFYTGWSGWSVGMAVGLFILAGKLHQAAARQKEQAERYRRHLRARAHAGLDGGTHDAQGDVSGAGTWT